MGNAASAARAKRRLRRGVINGGIVVAGGTKWVDGTKVWLDKIWWLDPKTLQWSAKGTLPHPIGYSVCSQWKDGVVIAGGFDGTKSRDEVWHLTPSFELKSVARLKTAVSIAQGGVGGDELIVGGGTPDVAKLDALFATAQHIHLSDGVAKEIASPSATPFGTAASAVIGSRLFIHGGVRHDAVKAVANLANAWAFDAGTKQWQALNVAAIRRCETRQQSAIPRLAHHNRNGRQRWTQGHGLAAGTGV